MLGNAHIIQYISLISHYKSFRYLFIVISYFTQNFCKFRHMLALRSFIVPLVFFTIPLLLIFTHVCNSENWKFVEKVKEKRRENVSQLSLPWFVGNWAGTERREGAGWVGGGSVAVVVVVVGDGVVVRWKIDLSHAHTHTHSHRGRFDFVVVMWQTKRWFLRYPKGQGRTHGHDNRVFSVVLRFFYLSLVFPQRMRSHNILGKLSKLNGNLRGLAHSRTFLFYSILLYSSVFLL